MASGPHVTDPLIGITLQGRYQVTRKIGEGGMGAVYEAQHTLIGKRVAVKVLLERYAQKTEIVARLQQEARLASAIGNEHIVDITDFGETEDGRTFVVMEYLEGESFADLIAREGPLSAERAIAIARQVADALGAAHQKGIVHRDVKPENIFLIRRNDKEFVKVVDFGISKILRPGDEELQRLTQTGMVLGTPLYMSPEQARGEEDLDHRIDIYALGVILYESVTGEVPFRGKNSLVIINQVLAADPRAPRDLRPDLGISEAFESVILHSMAKERGRRYQSMAELEKDLERLQAGELDVGPIIREPQPGAQTGAFARKLSERWMQVTALVVVAAATIIVMKASARATADPLPPVALVVPTIPVFAPASAPVPTMVTLTFTSSPSGAEVDLMTADHGYASLGVTPIVKTVPRSDAPALYRVRLAGYRPVDDKPISLKTDQTTPLSLDPLPRQMPVVAVTQTVKTSPPPATQATSQTGIDPVTGLAKHGP
jgi:tRNA A-37 threonylcarbamoyl transferase component Bud32